jgi:hypothetical protein
MIDSVDFSMVGVSAFTEDTPLVDGIDSYDPYLGGRQINMIISVYGDTYGDFWDKITALNFAFQAMPRAANTGTYAALDADGKRKMSFSQPKASGSYSLYMMVRPAAMPRFVVDNASVAGISERGYSTKVQVSLISEDPYKYFETAVTTSTTLSGTTGSISVVNSGTTVAWPTVTWNRTSSAAISATLGSYTVSHSAASGNVTDTFRTAESTSSSTLTAYSFFPIPPGTSSVSVTGQSGQTVSITIREALV